MVDNDGRQRFFIRAINILLDTVAEFGGSTTCFSIRIGPFSLVLATIF